MNSRINLILINRILKLQGAWGVKHAEYLASARVHTNRKLG